MDKGLLVVETGSAHEDAEPALGLALRSLGRGLRVCLISFVSTDRLHLDLDKGARLLERLEIHEPEQSSVTDRVGTHADEKASHAMWERAQSTIKSGGCEVMILHNLLQAITDGHLQESVIVDFLAHRPSGVHVIVTGCAAPESLIAAADLVTEICDIGAGRVEEER